MKARAVVSRLPLKRLLGFVLLPLLAAFAPLFVLPVIGRTLGAPGWAAIATGQSIGAASSILVAYGWPVVGPSIVAALDSGSRVRCFVDSLHMRLIIFFPVAAISVVLAAFLVDDEFRYASGLMSLSLCMVGLSPSWYYVGIAKPSSIALYDAVPRIIASIVSVPALLWTRDAVVYPLILLVATALGILLSALAVSGRQFLRRPRLYSLAVRAKQQWSIALSGLVTSGYTGFSVALVAIASGSVSTVASFAAAFRLEAMAKVGTGAVANGFQGWVGEVRNGRPARRMVAALSVTTLCGLVGGGFLSLFLPSLVNLVFGHEISISASVAVLAGIGFFLHSMTLSLSLHVLAPLDKIKTIATATIVAALLGVPIILLLTPTMGAQGAMLGVTLAEAVVLALELPVGIMAIRRTTLGQRPTREGLQAAPNEANSS